MQLILVSGLSGSGKSIALHVLEDAGYYCVDNLPATLLLEVVDFLAEAGHEKAAISVDARSAALAALPEHIEALRGRGVDGRVLYLEASTPTLLRRFSETRRKHPLVGTDLALPEAIEHERSLLASVAVRGHRIDTSDLQARVLQNWIRDLLGIGPGALTLLFESFAYRDGIPLDADWVRRPHAAQPPLRPEAAALHRARKRGDRVPRPRSLGRALARGRARPAGPLAARDRAREPQLGDRGGGLHRRAPPPRGPWRRPRRGLSQGVERAGTPPRPRAPGHCRMSEVALFPLNTVLFPVGRLPLRIFEKRYMW